MSAKTMALLVILAIFTIPLGAFYYLDVRLATTVKSEELKQWEVSRVADLKFSKCEVKDLKDGFVLAEVSRKNDDREYLLVAVPIAGYEPQRGTQCSVSLVTTYINSTANGDKWIFSPTADSEPLRSRTAQRSLTTSPGDKKAQRQSLHSLVGLRHF